MSWSRSWSPSLSMHCSMINRIMYAVKTVYTECIAMLAIDSAAGSISADIGPSVSLCHTADCCYTLSYTPALYRVPHLQIWTMSARILRHKQSAAAATAGRSGRCAMDLSLTHFRFRVPRQGASTDGSRPVLSTNPVTGLHLSTFAHSTAPRGK